MLSNPIYCLILFFMNIPESPHFPLGVKGKTLEFLTLHTIKTLLTFPSWTPYWSANLFFYFHWQQLGRPRSYYHKHRKRQRWWLGASGWFSSIKFKIERYKNGLEQKGWSNKKDKQATTVDNTYLVELVLATYTHHLIVTQIADSWAVLVADYIHSHIP